MTFYFHFGPLQNLFADKSQNKKRNVTLNPMKKENIEESQSKDVDTLMFEFQISEKFSLDQVLENITRFCCESVFILEIHG